MTLLYLTEDFFASKVHYNLLNQMLKRDSSLVIYVFSPRRPGYRKDLSSSFDRQERLIIISPLVTINSKLYKYVFYEKIRHKISLVSNLIDISSIDRIHAATLYSDGFVAYKLSQKYSVPFSVSIRGTDASLYSHYFFNLWPLANSVINSATSISFISDAIKKRIVNCWQYFSVKKKLIDSPVITNGVDDIWIEKRRRIIPRLSSPIRVLFIGRFDSNKNAEGLIHAVLSLRRDIPIHLTLVGGTGNKHDSIMNLVSNNSEAIEYLGEVYDKEKLITEVRKCHIFAMPSHKETFGLVYAECLSQGLPLLYSLHTGFDGIYPQGFIGYGINSHDIDSISSGLKSIINNYETLSRNISDLDFDRFSWSRIAEDYMQMIKNGF